MKMKTKSTLVLKILSVIFVGVFLTGCSVAKTPSNLHKNDGYTLANSSKKAADEQQAKKPKVEFINPFGGDTLSLRDIKAEKTKYFNKEVIIGPMAVYDNNVETSMFRVYPVIGMYENLNTPKADMDVNIDVFYKKLSDEKIWRNLASGNKPVIYVKGIVKAYSNTGELYIEATTILENSSTQKASGNSSAVPSNPFGGDTLSLRDIKAEKSKYFNKEVIIGPMAIYNNNVETSMFRVYPVIGKYENLNMPKTDMDVNIDVFYKKLSDEKVWRNLSSDNKPVIYVKGIVKAYSNTGELYIEATQILQAK